MASNGVNLGIGIDLSAFKKDLSYVNKELLTVAGQKAVIDMNFKFPKQGEIGKRLAKELSNAQKNVNDAMKNISNLTFKNTKGEFVNIDGISDAIKALKQYKKEYDTILKSGGDTSGISKSISYVQEYIKAVGRLSNAMSRAGVSGTDKQSANFKKERTEIDKEIKLLKQRKEIISADPNLKSLTKVQEEIRLQRQIIVLLQKKNETYRSGSSKANEAVISSARRELEILQKQNRELRKKSGLLSGLKSLATQYISIFSAWNFAKKIVETTGYFEQQQIALTGILRSASEAQEAVNQLKAMAIESPFEFKDLVGFTKQLSAYGIEQKKLIPVTKELADLSAGLGVDMSRLILAYGQVSSASVLRGQELRQFTEAGIPLVQALADKFTELNGKLVTTGEVFDLISKRQVPFEMVAEVLSDMTAEGGSFYKMQENITDTLYGQVQKLKDIWTITLNDMGSGIGSLLRGAVEFMQKIVKESKTLITIVASGVLLNLLNKSLLRLRDIHVWLGRTNAEIKKAGKGIASIKAIAKSAYGAIAISVLSVAIGLIKRAIDKAKEFGEEMNKVSSSFEKDTSKYISGFDKLLGKLSSVTEGTRKYNEALDTLKSNYGDYVNPEIIDQLVAERKALDKTAEGWGILHDSIVAAIKAKKDYEMHEALKETAGNKAIERMISGNIAKSQLEIALHDIATDIRIQNNNESDNERKTIRDNEARRLEFVYGEAAFEAALESFFSAGETTESELKKRVADNLKTYGFLAETTKYVTEEEFGKIWDKLSVSLEFKRYLKEHEIISNSAYEQIKKRYDNAQRTTAGRNERRWREGMRNEEYNPIEIIRAGQFDASNAAKDLITGLFTNEIKKKIEYGAKESELYNKGQYEAAMSNLNAVFDTIKDADSFLDAGKTKEVADAMQQLLGSIIDPSLRNALSEIQGQFNDLAGTKTGRAASVSTNIEKDFLESGVLDHNTKDFFARYVKNTTDATFDEVRKGIANDIKKLEEEIKGYGNTQGNAANREYVEGLKKDLANLKILAGERYYDIEDTTNKGGQNVTISAEFSEFVNVFKDAYARYKEAVQKGGVEMGLGYVRNDKQFQDMFGAFFNGAGSEALEKFNNVKIGGKGVGDMLQDKFITDGLEKGVLDFEGAALSVAEELKAYYEKDTTHRKSFLDAAKELEKWVYSVISKDNLSKTLDKLNKEMQDLTLTFEKTKNGAELYRKLIANGTAGALGGTIGQKSVQTAQTPQSVLLKENLKELVGLFNKQVAEISNGEGTPFVLDVGDGGINGMYQALEQITKQREMNKENFSATELGNTSGKIEQVIRSIIQAIEQEMSGISGEVYTGNSLRDFLANAGQREKSGVYELTSKENIAREHGAYDYKAVQDMLGKISSDANSFFDKFIKDSRFDVIARDNLGNVDFEPIKKKFLEMIKDVPPILKDELQRKLKDLELHIQTLNSSTGALGSLGAAASSFFKADKIGAKLREDEEERYDAIQREYEYAQEAGDNNRENSLKTQLEASKKELERLGEGGKNAAEEIRKISAENMVKSLEAAQKDLDKMSSAVTSVVSAFKSLSDAVNKVYDIMNDGENPDWMSDMGDFLGDFADDFEALIAPIGAVIAAITAVTIAITILGTTTTAILGAFVAFAVVIASIMAAFQQHDRQLERSIESLKGRIDELDTAMENLRSEAGRSVGFDKLSKEIDAYGLSITKASNAANMAAAEDAKKNTDEEKLKEYKQQQIQYMNEFLDGMREIRDELLATTEDWASSMGNAIRSAFQNGENAARAFRGTVKEMIGDVVENMLEMSILQPMIENALEGWTNQEALKKKHTKQVKNEDTGEMEDVLDFDSYMKELLQNIGDPKKAEEFYQKMLEAGYTEIDAINGLPDFLKETLGYNSDMSSLSGGIEGISEDTARRLEALGNSQLGALLNIQSILQNYIMGSGGFASSPMADIQTSIALIQSDTAGIRVATQTILSEMKSLRTTNSQPLHVTVV